MGYCVRLTGQKFLLPATKVEDCLNHILNIKDEWLPRSIKDTAKNVKYFDHIPSNFRLIELVKYMWGLEFIPNKNNDIDKIEWEWEKMSDFESFCNAVAPFVDDGYLEWTGEDSSKWRYVFHSGKWKRVNPVITWPE